MLRLAMASQLGLSTTGVVALAVLAWAAVVVFAVAMMTAAARADRMQAHALREAEWVDELAEVRSPSGEPFFRTELDVQLLLQSITDLRAEFFKERPVL